MKIFISSVISGFEPFREAAKAAIKTLRHEPVMAEDFGSRPTSSQIACLSGVRSADLVLLILGARYGQPQASGMSPTHEEYAEARDTKPILTFVQRGVDREPAQEKFVAEVGAWQAGLHRESFSTPEELREMATTAIHDYQLAHASGPVDPAALVERAVALVAADRRQGRNGSTLSCAFVGGPLSRILRPAQIEAASLAKDLKREAMFGDANIFDEGKGAKHSMRGSSLVLEQDDGARVELDEEGSLLIRLPLQRGRSGFDIAIIEETVVSQLGAAIAYASWVLAKIDHTQRLTDVAIAAAIDAPDHLGWRTKAEDAASPGSGQLRSGRGADAPVHVTRKRAALAYEARELAEDLMVPLRRQRATSR